MKSILRALVPARERHRTSASAPRSLTAVVGRRSRRAVLASVVLVSSAAVVAPASPLAALGEVDLLIGDIGVVVGDTEGVDEIAAGSSGAFYAEVLNLGSATAVNVTMWIEAEAPILASTPPNCTLDAGTIACPLGNIAPGFQGSRVVEVPFDVPPDAEPGSAGVRFSVTTASVQNPNVQSDEEFVEFTIVAGPATISGVVTGSDGQPIEGVFVRDSYGFAQTTVTDVDGAYSLEFVSEEDSDGVVQPIDTFVEFTKPGYLFQCYPGPCNSTIRVERGDEIVANVTLLRAASISGSLTGPGGELVFASIRATDQDKPLSQLDWSDTGTYTIPSVPPGRYIVQGRPIWPSALAAEVWQDGYDYGDATIVEVEEGEVVTGIDLTFEVGATISGRVTEHDGDPLPFTTVQAERSDAHLVGDTSSDWYVNSTTDADGFFVISGIAPGEYVVRANPYQPDEVFYPSAGSFDAATKISVGLGDVVTGIEIQEQPPGTSEVRVFNAIGLAAGSGGTAAICPAGTQLVDAGSVTCSGGPLRAQAPIDAGGYASFEAVPAGSYRIGVIRGSDLLTDDFDTTLDLNDVFDCYVDVDLADVFCAVSPDDPPPVSDDDGVPAAVEDGAPNNGDGNNDGIADSQQEEVSSLPAAIGTGYVTIAAPDGTSLRAVSVTPAPASPPLPPGASLDAGVISFTLAGVSVGGEVDIDIHLSDGTTATDYLKLQAGSWVTLPPGAFSVAGNVITLHLVDGGVGDEDGMADGVITDPGAPARIPPAWTLNGFYQPVDMSGTLNVVKGGSTVPLKFEVFAGQTELTETSVVTSFTQTKIACETSVPTDVIEVTTTGGTSLRYDTTGGQFIQNWKTPKLPGKCYQVTMTIQDGSSLSALFKLK